MMVSLGEENLTVGCPAWHDPCMTSAATEAVIDATIPAFAVPSLEALAVGRERFEARRVRFAPENRLVVRVSWDHTGFVHGNSSVGTKRAKKWYAWSGDAGDQLFLGATDSLAGALDLIATYERVCAEIVDEIRSREGG